MWIKYGDCILNADNAARIAVEFTDNYAMEGECWRLVARQSFNVDGDDWEWLATNDKKILDKLLNEIFNAMARKESWFDIDEAEEKATRELMDTDY